MKTKILNLIREYHIRISALKADREIALKLGFSESVTALSSKIAFYEMFIKELSEL